MTIGILTFHNADNYGAVLQCYALQEKLKELHPNDEIYVIDYKCSKIVNFYIPKINYQKPWSIFGYAKTKAKCKKFQEFRNKYLNLGHSDFSKYDVIYYGSDQIWNTTLTENDLMFFGKGFSGKKIAYGASDGGELQLTSEIETLLTSFFSISCREKTLTDKIISNTDINQQIDTICDPVFLLTKDQWLKIAKLPKDTNYILAYKVSDNPNFDSEAEQLGQRLGKRIIQIVYVKSLRKLFYHRQSITDGIGPEEFVGYFAKADYVLTTSFHGTAFAVIFDKPFFVLEFSKRSERITDMLSLLGVEDRYGKRFKYNSNHIKDLEKYRESGVNFLKKYNETVC